MPHPNSKNLPSKHPLTGAKSSLRRTLRTARRALSNTQHQRHSAQLLHNATSTLLTLRFHSFALYLPADGEINTWPLINKLLSFGIQVGLPCLRKDSTGRLRMHFANYDHTTPLVRGHYDLLEPQRHANARSAFLPDIMLLPLVGFDAAGHRLGMGGGFYDRYANPMERAKPALRIGLAHELQGLSSDSRLPVNSWDVPLDGVITEAQVTGFSRRGRVCL